MKATKMAHVSGRNIEPPRPLKARLSVKTNSFMLIEELIQLMESVALTLQSGVNNTETITQLVQNLRVHGPQLEIISKDTLDRSFVVFRNASQDERLNIMTRLKLLELIELRAKSWEDGSNAYYKIKQANSADVDMLQQQHQQQQQQSSHQHHQQQQLQQQQHQQQMDAAQAAYMSTSPTFGGVTGGVSGNTMTSPSFAGVGSAQQQQLLLAPGEVIRNSGKFPKPTKIPGKTYCKDEVVIRNADSGKVMGIKGRRVHMIEELSETIISFQRVNPGAKERLVQITGPGEDKVNYAKTLIEDTIRRNASPVRLEGPGAPPVAGAGSCSSLASSNSDEVQPRTPGTPSVSSNLQNRLSFNSAQNFMTSQAAAQQMLIQQQQQQVVNIISNNNAVANKMMRPSQQVLLHSYSTNDASLGEYKYTVNVGQHLIKITGDCCELVRMAKLVLDDYFSSREFLATVEAGAAFDSTYISPLSTPSTPLGAPPQFMLTTTLQADSGVGLNYIANQAGNNGAEGDDEVFAEANANTTTPNNSLARSRRSHFSRNAATPEETSAAVAAAVGDVTTDTDNASAGVVGINKKSPDNASVVRLTYNFDHLLFYSQSLHSWSFPTNWSEICEKYPSICRNKELQDEAQRFDGQKYLELIKSSSKRNIAVVDETDNQDND